MPSCASTLPWLDRIFGKYHLPDAYGIKAKMPVTLIERLARPAPATPPDPRPPPSPSTGSWRTVRAPPAASPGQASVFPASMIPERAGTARMAVTY